MLIDSKVEWKFWISNIYAMQCNAFSYYAMQCFLFPKSLCTKLQNVLNRFWWRNAKMAKGIHWSYWKDLCVLKLEGGLGFRDFACFNESLLAKQCWRIWTQPDCLLAKVLKARYHQYSDFMLAGLGSYLTLTWRSIIVARGLLEMGSGWQIEDSASVNI